MYPEVLTSNSYHEKAEILDELVNSYLLKDILMHEKVKSSKLLSDLIKLLAFQVGNLVSFNELANTLGINLRTVSKYIDLLEKSYVIFRLSGFSNNLRNEISAKSKYYFFDNGIRNAVIKQFNEISLRNDIGALWENFIISERMKKLSYQRLIYNRYFWRNYNHQEIDLLEEANGEIRAYEFKWTNKKIKIPANFTKKYGETIFSVIHRENYLDFIL
jgi:predicted AAA+ superfamily ATPase